jgi:carboxyl-terminal processing protease
MLPASNRGAGQNLAFPDVCNTPVGPATVPIPYPNIAMNMQALMFSVTVKVSMMNALNMGSMIPMTNGDNAGVAHPTVMGQAKYTMGNPIVFIDKLPGICLACPTTGNNMNAPLGAVLVPSAVNVFYTLASPTSEGSDGGGDLLGELRERATTLSSTDVSASFDDGVLSLRVPAFPADIVRRVHAATHELPLEELRLLTIDLRGNPGGELSAAVDLAAEIVPEGSLVARVVDADGDEEELRTTRPPRFEVPVILFVDGGTASTAEVFAAALREAGRAILVGQPTFGKRESTALHVQPDGQATLAHVLTWLGDGQGPLAPDVAVGPSSG